MDNFEYFKNGKVLFNIDTNTEEYKNALKGTSFEDIYNINLVNYTKNCIDNLNQQGDETVLRHLPHSVLNKEVCDYAFNIDTTNYDYIPYCYITQDMADIAISENYNKLSSLANTPENLIKPEYFDIEFTKEDI